ncbi:MAG: hypothetical protein WC028_01480 [Candidatus Obscuribacterales bacterium]
MRMKLKYFTVLALSLACGLQAPLLALTNDYKGTIGTRGIGLTMGINRPASLKDKSVCGYYFYNDVMKNSYLEGGQVDHGEFVLYELDAKGSRKSVFTCKYAKEDPAGHFKGELSDEVIVGVWSRLDGTDRQPLYLAKLGGVGAEGDRRYAVADVENDSAFEAKVQKWRNAVISGDKKIVVSMISYPIAARVNGRQKNLKNADQLLKNYDGVFTLKYVGAIGNAVPHNMFVNSHGVMLGDTGEVWFDAAGKVKSLNNY